MINKIIDRLIMLSDKFISVESEGEKITPTITLHKYKITNKVPDNNTCIIDRTPRCPFTGSYLSGHLHHYEYKGIDYVVNKKKMRIICRTIFCFSIENNATMRALATICILCRRNEINRLERKTLARNVHFVHIQAHYFSAIQQEELGERIDNFIDDLLPFSYY